MGKRQPSVGIGLLCGIFAGMVATIAMDQFQKLSAAGQKNLEKRRKLAQGESPWVIAHENVLEEQVAAAHEGSTEKVARKIVEATGSILPHDRRKQAGQIVHYTFGTLMGAAYGVSAEMLPEITTGGGAAFGTALFLGADEIAVPALRLSPPATDTAPADHLQYWAAHVVYGGALELMRSLLRRIV
jgi:hypothetical protein